MLIYLIYSGRCRYKCALRRPPFSIERNLKFIDIGRFQSWAKRNKCTMSLECLVSESKDIFRNDRDKQKDPKATLETFLLAQFGTHESIQVSKFKNDGNNIVATE